MTVKSPASELLMVRTPGDINLKGIAGSGQAGAFNLDFIYTPVDVFITAAGFVQDGRNDGLVNIDCDDLVLTTASIGSLTNPVEIELKAVSLLTASATAGGIWLKELTGDVNVLTITTNMGDTWLSTPGSILDAQDETGGALLNISGRGIFLTATGGTIGVLSNPLEINSANGGAGNVSATSLGDIFLTETIGDLSLGNVHNTNARVFLVSPASILNGIGLASGFNIDAASLKFTAGTSAGSNIGSASAPILTRISRLVGTAGGSMWLENTGTLTVGPIADGGTNLTAGGSANLKSSTLIEQADNALITATSIKLQAATGIGTTLQLRIDLQGGQLDASTNSGVINIREVSGDIKVGQIIDLDGNVTLVAQGSLVPATAEALVQGNLLDLTAETGAIAAGTNVTLRINSSSAGVRAVAISDIHLTETNGNLTAISIVSSSGHIIVDVLSGSLIDGNASETTDTTTQGELLGVWTGAGITGGGSGSQYTAAQIKSLLQASHFKQLTDTDYRFENLNISGSHVILNTSGGIGDIREFTVNFSDGLATLTDETRLMLAAAEPGDIVFYNSANAPVDPASGSVAYLKIFVHEDVDILASTDVTITATGDIYLSSEEDLKLITVSGADTRLRSGKLIRSALGAEGLNITCGSLLLEAAAGTIGTVAMKLGVTVKSPASEFLMVRSSGDINLLGIAGSGQTGAFNLDFIYTPVDVRITAADFIQDGRNDGLVNINSDDLYLTAASIGSLANPVEIELAKQQPADGKRHCGRHLARGIDRRHQCHDHHHQHG